MPVQPGRSLVKAYSFGLWSANSLESGSSSIWVWALLVCLLLLLVPSVEDMLDPMVGLSLNVCFCCNDVVGDSLNLWAECPASVPAFIFRGSKASSDRRQDARAT